ncbi:pentapeptide repeat-containing protein [Streptomyces manipurensis]|uniref:pentapeptide repeat-containing protein n=1 Tax=Streptomyces manipurensis TaxID=1077945 RepID=UPI003C6FBD72
MPRPAPGHRLHRGGPEWSPAPGGESDGANFYEANLTDARLDGAEPQSVNLTRAVVNAEGTTFHGASVDAHTCRPDGVVQEKVDSVTVTNDGQWLGGSAGAKPVR